jgi:hypothetical protein
MVNMATQNMRISITISPSDLKLLRKWGDFHGKSPAEFAAQIVASRIEANIELIHRLGEVREALDKEGDPPEDESL